MKSALYTVDLGYGVERFATLQEVSDRQFDDITPRCGSSEWYERIHRRGGGPGGAAITRNGVVVGRVSYNGRLWAPSPPGVRVPLEVERGSLVERQR